MLRFWLIGALGCSLAACAGRNIQGAWYGQMPFEAAQECRIRLQPGGEFDFTCAEGSWSGTGRYALKNETLTLTYGLVLIRDQPLRRPPAEQVFEVSGPGNEITLDMRGGGTLVWRRELR